MLLLTHSLGSGKVLSESGLTFLSSCCKQKVKEEGKGRGASFLVDASDVTRGLSGEHNGKENLSTQSRCSVSLGISHLSAPSQLDWGLRTHISYPGYRHSLGEPEPACDSKGPGLKVKDCSFLFLSAWKSLLK